MRMRGRLALAAALLVGSVALAAAQRANYFTASFDLTNSASTVKAGPGTLLSLECYNPNAVETFVQFFDTASAVTVGTTVPTLSFKIPQLTTSGMLTPYPSGAAYGAASGMKAAAATTATGGVAPTSAMTCDFFYR